MAILFASGALIAGCGATEEDAADEETTSTEEQTSTEDTAVASAAFKTSCEASGGGIVTTSSGTEACQDTTSYAYTGSYQYWLGAYFPVLTEADPDASTAYNTGMEISAGDRIEFSGIGSWSTTNVETYTSSWGPFSWSVTTIESQCNSSTLSWSLSRGRFEDLSISLEGYSVASNAFGTNGTLPMGFVGSDGTAVFSLGDQATVTAANSGTLRIGFNAPDVSGNCGMVYYSQLDVIHCEDSAGTTVTCPE